jgi:ParB/RepB/Spo0J family partition protein
MEDFRNVSTKLIKPSNNPNRAEVGDLPELMRSIKQSGLLNPILVQERKKGQFEVVHGHRRFEACKKLGWTEIPTQVTGKLKDVDAIVMNHAENIQRRQPSLIEEANTYQQLLKRKLTKEEISARLGISNVRVSQALNLLNKVPVKYREKIYGGMRKGDNDAGKISFSMAHHVINEEKTATKTSTRAKLWEAAFKGASKREVSQLRLGLDGGLTESEVKRKQDNIVPLRISLVMNKRKANKFERDEGQTVHEFARELLEEELSDILV